MKINFIGTILGTSGYDNHCRQLVNALYELNSDIKLEIPLQPGWETLVNDGELNMITKEVRKADVTIAVTQPQFWRLSMDNCDKFVGFCVWEGDKIPKYWLEYLMDERVSQIWVPSQHTKDAILKTAQQKFNSYVSELECKIKIVPHGVDLTIFKPQEVKKDKFTFICNKGWRGGWEDRGGVAYVLKAFCEEFNKDEPVQLILKLNPSYINPQNIQVELDKLKLPTDRPEIKINCNNIPYRNLGSLYNQADVYVCAQRADAFNLPGLEAMGCGLPTIQTGYGGQTDYIDNGNNGWTFNYHLEEVKGDITYEGIKWAVPNVDELKKIMRVMYNDKEGTKQKGEQAFIDVGDWTWHNSAKKGLSFLREL